MCIYFANVISTQKITWFVLNTFKLGISLKNYYFEKLNKTFCHATKLLTNLKVMLLTIVYKNYPTGGFPLVICNKMIKTASVAKIRAFLKIKLSTEVVVSVKRWN